MNANDAWKLNPSASSCINNFNYNKIEYCYCVGTIQYNNPNEIKYGFYSELNPTSNGFTVEIARASGRTYLDAKKNLIALMKENVLLKQILATIE